MRAWLASKGVRRTEPEFELRDALGQPGCPVCRLALRTAVRQLDIISYEAVLDLDLRAQLRAARGFCRRHAWQFLEETRDPLGTALIYRDVVNTLGGLLAPLPWPARLAGAARSFLRARTSGAAGPDAGLARSLAPSAGCPPCAAQRETEELYLRLLVERLPEASFLAAYAGSSGLCWPHLLLALERVGSRAALDALVERYSREEQAGDAPAPVSADPGAKGGCEPGQRESPLAGLMAAEFGFLRARRSALPASLVVDVQRRRLEEVIRPGGPAAPACPACRLVAPALATPSSPPSPTSNGDPAQALGTLCDRHAWALPARHGAGLMCCLLGLRQERRTAVVAAVARAGLARAVLAPSGEPSPRRLGRQVAEALRPSGACPACEAEQAAHRRAVAEALRGGETDALCLQHLLLAGEQTVSPGVWRAQLARQAAAWRSLSGELGEYIRKHDYRFHHEPRGAEQSSPWRAVELIAGPRDATVG